MLIYHGNLVDVPNPKILVSGKIGDFGYGFYTALSFKQAQCEAQIRAVQEKLSSGVVTVFEADDALLTNPALKILRFEKADASWLDFVLESRKNPEFSHPFDIVAGPGADDRVYTCLNALESGFADRETVLRQLETCEFFDQILFHTAKALLFLNFHHTEIVSCSQK